MSSVSASLGKTTHSHDGAVSLMRSDGKVFSFQMCVHVVVAFTLQAVASVNDIDGESTAGFGSGVDTDYDTEHSDQVGTGGFGSDVDTEYDTENSDDVDPRVFSCQVCEGLVACMHATAFTSAQHDQAVARRHVCADFLCAVVCCCMPLLCAV